MSRLVMDILDEMEAEREKILLAECIDDFSTEWDEYVSEWG